VYIITIDTGTTNTRIKVWKENQVIASSSIQVGVRDTAITGSKQTLQQGVKTAIQQALENANITYNDIKLVLASGMITSNVGLYEVPHITAPAGIEELAQGMVKVDIPEVIEQPIWFVPGIKNNIKDINIENCESMDIMRGEEVEAFGIIEKLGVKRPALVILPGSHSKFIRVDEQNKITSCVTSLAGELLSVITKNTILSNALEGSFVNQIDAHFILKGAQHARKVGLNRSCFTVRILDQFTSYSTQEKANFLAGIIFGTDLLAIKNSSALQMNSELPVIIGGSRSLKRIFEVLIKSDHYFKGEVKVIDDELMKDIAGFGAVTIARKRGLL
jgi:2-dehydro-3-deoxygalactonokinase